MKKIPALIIFLFLSVNLIGCSAPKNNAGVAALPEDAVISPDGRYAVRANIQENLEDEDGLIYSIFDVQLYDSAEKTLLCTYHIIGRDFRFLWSPDSKYIAAAYSGRTWTAFSILDVKRHYEFSRPSLSGILGSFKSAGEEIGYEFNLNRPDPYVTPLEWSPDSTRLLVSYQVRDAGYQTQSGLFIYNLAEGTYTDLLQSPPSEADRVEVKKPEDFTWS